MKIYSKRKTTLLILLFPLLILLFAHFFQGCSYDKSSSANNYNGNANSNRHY